MTLFLILLTSIDSLTILYNQGNRYYTEGDYLAAIEVYNRALNFGINKDLYYNLGNAYFKAGKIGKAIIQYREARFLSPRHGAVNYNLNFVRNYRVDKNLSIPNPIISFLSQVFHFFSYIEAFKIAGFSFFLGAIFLSCFIIYRNKYLLGLSIFIFLLFAFFFISCLVWNGEIKGNWGVVIMPEVKVMSGPGEEYKEILEIHDGTEARIIEERGGYYLIQLPGGIGGWIRKTSIERIY